MIKSIKLKMVLIIALLCAALLSIECFATYKRVQVEYEDLLNDSYRLTTDNYTKTIEGWLKDEIGTLNAVKMAVIGSDSSTPERKARSIENIVDVLETATAEDEITAMVYVLLEDGSFYNGSKWDHEGFDFRIRPWYTEPMAHPGTYFFSSPYVDGATGDLIVSIATSFNSNGWTGVVGVDIYISTLLSDIGDLTAAEKNGSYLFVTAGDDTMIYHPNSEYEPEVDNIKKITDLPVDYVAAAADDDADAIKDYNGVDVYVTAASMTDATWKVYYVSPAENFDNAVGGIRNTGLTILIICLAIAIIVAIIAGIMIAKPISDASSKVKFLANEVKNRNADLTFDITTSSKDEVGELVSSVNELKDAIGEIISEINVASNDLVSNVQVLNTAADKTSDNVSSISSTMEEMSASSEETSASATQVSSQIKDITELTARVNRNSSEKTNDISKSLKNVDALKDKIEKNDAEMSVRLNDAIRVLKDRITDTKKVEDIQQMTQGISDVASQTNLLSLNASIEAARAGEAGRGFAVVADEIGALANNSAEMASSIQKVSDEVLAIVDQLVKAAEQVSDIMLENSAENTKEKDSILSEYKASLTECYEAISSISDDNGEISSNIERIKDSIDAIDRAVEENAKGISTVAEGTNILVDASENVLTSAKSVNDISSTLKDHVKGFKC